MDRQYIGMEWRFVDGTATSDKAGLSDVPKRSGFTSKRGYLGTVPLAAPSAITAGFRHEWSEASDLSGSGGK